MTKFNECHVIHRINPFDGGFNVAIEMIDLSTQESVFKTSRRYNTPNKLLAHDHSVRLAYSTARDCGFDHVKEFNTNFNLEGEI